jgi:hypothetical protein
MCITIGVYQKKVFQGAGIGTSEVDERRVGHSDGRVDGPGVGTGRGHTGEGGQVSW